MQLNTRFDTYEQFKQELDQEFNKSVEGFVKIGYLLKYARETDILHNSGYQNLTEFAEAEYHIDASQVSRFIQINDRFSEGGNSMVLKEKYRGFGYAKLTIMLQLPEEINEELTPEFSKREIQTIQEEVKEEKKTSDLEVMLEGEAEAVKEFNLLGKSMHQLLEDEPDLFLELWKAEREVIKIQEILCPTGEGMKGVRLQGIGRLMISFKESQINLVNLRCNEKESFTWGELIELLGVNDGTDGKEKWTSIYRKPFPTQEIAPVQPQKPTPTTSNTKKPEKKPEKRKESKVTKAKVKPKDKPVEVQKEEPKTEEQLPGQTSLENDFPEYMPEPEENQENENEISENETEFEENEPEKSQDKTESVENEPEKKSFFEGLSPEEIQKKREEYKTAVYLRTKGVDSSVELDLYLAAITELKETISLIEKLQQLEDYEAELRDE